MVAVAKRDLRAGETLDGEGGYTVYGKLVPTARSLATGALPIGLAHGVKLTQDVLLGSIVRAADVLLDNNIAPVQIRREMADQAICSEPGIEQRS